MLSALLKHILKCGKQPCTPRSAMNTLNSERRNVIKTGLALLGASVLPGPAAGASEKESAQKRPAAANLNDASACGCERAADGSLLDIAFSELRPMIERYQVDLRDMYRTYPMTASPTRRAKLEAFFAGQ